MITIEQIINEMGNVWFERTKEEARTKYNSHWNARDLSKIEYMNMYVRHAYGNVKRANEKLNIIGGDSKDE